MGTLYQPRCEYQRRDHPSPVGLRLEAPAGGTSWSLRVCFWGGHALAHTQLVAEALARAGANGLGDAMGPLPFEYVAQQDRAHCLAEWCDRPVPAAARLTFVTPCQSRAGDLATLLGNMAHDLTQWALSDEGSSAELGKRGCDALADAARERAGAALTGVEQQWLGYRDTDPGARQSRTNRGKFLLKGFTGAVVVSGDLAPAWPCLQALTLYGAGGRRGFGLGRVSLQAEEE